jgi:hypothetical protein
VAHRSGIYISVPYKLLKINIEIEDDEIAEVRLDTLPPGWKSIACYPELQEIGSAWYQSCQSLVLKVLINTRHPQFSSKVSVRSVEDFERDNRLF